MLCVLGESFQTTALLYLMLFFSRLFGLLVLFFLRSAVFSLSTYCFLRGRSSVQISSSGKTKNERGKKRSQYYCQTIILRDWMQGIIIIIIIILLPTYGGFRAFASWGYSLVISWSSNTGNPWCLAIQGNRRESTWKAMSECTENGGGPWHIPMPLHSSCILGEKGRPEA